MKLHYLIYIFILGFFSHLQADECTNESIVMGKTISGTWTNKCSSTYVDESTNIGFMAKYYTFSLENQTLIEIDVNAEYYIRQGLDHDSEPIMGGYDFPQSESQNTLDAGTYNIEIISGRGDTSGSSFTLALSMQKRLLFQYSLPPSHDYFKTHSIEILSLGRSYKYDKSSDSDSRATWTLTKSQIETLKTTGEALLIRIDGQYTLPYHFGQTNAIGTTYCDVTEKLIVDVNEENINLVPIDINLSTLPNIALPEISKAFFHITNRYGTVLK